jgi:NAD(P)-dependent dehydrogenase (short-subunit alcohol dehydrogenase family)
VNTTVLSNSEHSRALLRVTLPPDGHVALSCDVSQELEVKAAFQEILQSCGKITYLVNSAGINR